MVCESQLRPLIKSYCSGMWLGVHYPILGPYISQLHVLFFCKDVSVTLPCEYQSLLELTNHSLTKLEKRSRSMDKVAEEWRAKSEDLQQQVNFAKMKFLLMLRIANMYRLKGTWWWVISIRIFLYHIMENLELSK